MRYKGQNTEVVTYELTGDSSRTGSYVILRDELDEEEVWLTPSELRNAVDAAADRWLEE